MMRRHGWRWARPTCISASAPSRRLRSSTLSSSASHTLPTFGRRSRATANRLLAVELKKAAVRGLFSWWSRFEIPSPQSLSGGRRALALLRGFGSRRIAPLQGVRVVAEPVHTVGRRKIDVARLPAHLLGVAPAQRAALARRHAPASRVGRVSFIGVVECAVRPQLEMDQLPFGGAKHALARVLLAHLRCIDSAKSSRLSSAGCGGSCGKIRCGKSRERGERDGGRKPDYGDQLREK